MNALIVIGVLVAAVLAYRRVGGGDVAALIDVSDLDSLWKNVTTNKQSSSGGAPGGEANSGGASLLSEWARAIAAFEGWGKSGSLAQRNNNPGNLRYAGQSGAVQGERGFAKFSTPEAGWAALERQLGLYVARDPNKTLAQQMAVYAPSLDGNDPAAYAAYVAKRLGASVTDTLGSLFGGRNG